jgi:hypothetical protein
LDDFSTYDTIIVAINEKASSDLDKKGHFFLVVITDGLTQSRHLTRLMTMKRAAQTEASSRS